MSKPISPLRQRMIDDMTIRNMLPNTQKIYTRAVANFSAFHGRSPDQLGIEDIRAYRLHLIQRGLKATLATGTLRPLRRPTAGSPISPAIHIVSRSRMLDCCQYPTAQSAFVGRTTDRAAEPR